MGVIKVKGHYRTLPSGKRVFVREHTITKTTKSGGGDEYTSRKGDLVEYNSWEDFRDDINKIGWENMTLTKLGRKYKIENGRKVTYMSDPRNGESKYMGLRVGGKLVAAANVYDEGNIVYVGDFEVFPEHKRKGYGGKFWKQIERKYPNRQLMLNYGDRKAKKFWESQGFIAEKNITLMTKKQ